MELEEIASIIQIGDPEIDVQTIMTRIRAGLIEHALESEIEFPTFAVARAQRGEVTRFSQDLYDQLEQANLNYDQIWVELSLIERQMPLIGPFVNRFKRELHRVVVYYVNMLGERQVTMNDALVRVLNQLVESLETPDPQVKALERRVAELEARLERLEAQGREGD